jgi:hypothetical protein
MAHSKTFFLGILFFIVASHINAQTDTSKPFKTKNVIWFTPNGINKINGLAVGFQALNVGDEIMIINGLNADVGMGGILGLPYLLANATKFKKNKIKDFLLVDTAKTIINGLSISLGGEFVVSVNGINITGGITSAANLNGLSLSGIYTKCNTFKGVCFAGLNNIATKGIGLQIGLFNNCKDLKGFQFGLWNKSGKRGLPLINWGI